jgi:hypothetical protein
MQGSVLMHMGLHNQTQPIVYQKKLFFPYYFLLVKLLTVTCSRNRLKRGYTG